MIQNPLISIIVPVYNVASTLERCVKSLTTQTYRHLEILLVNDGSTDQSENICQQLANSDQRIHVYTQTNQGLSAARNTGVKHAHGEFVSFVDSDDYVDSSFIESLVNETRKNPQIDLVICGFITNNPAFHKEEVPKEHFLLPGHVYLEKCLQNPPIYDVVAWTKLYRTSLCQSVTFPVGKVHEDEFTYYRFIDTARFVATVPQPLYHYTFNEEGITSTESIENGFDGIEAYQQRLSYQMNHQLSKRTINRTSRGIIVAILNMRHKHLDMTQSAFFSLIKQYFGQSVVNSLNAARFSFSPVTKFLYILFLHEPKLLCALYEMKLRIQSTL